MPVSLEDLRQALEDAITAEDIEDSEDLSKETVTSIVESFEANAKTAFVFANVDEDEDGELTV